MNPSSELGESILATLVSVLILNMYVNTISVITY